PLFYHLTRTSGAFQAFANSHALRLVRDPRGVAKSLETPKEYASVSGVKRMKSSTALRSIPYWLAMNITSDRVVDDNTPYLRYEDLPKERYRKLMSDLGHNVVSLSVSSNRHQLIANPVRQQGRTTFKLDKRWLSMPPTKRLLVSAVLFPWMRRYGYQTPFARK